MAHELCFARGECLLWSIGRPTRSDWAGEVLAVVHGKAHGQRVVAGNASWSVDGRLADRLIDDEGGGGVDTKSRAVLMGPPSKGFCGRIPGVYRFEKLIL
jgi:hypothetical protein